MSDDDVNDTPVTQAQIPTQNEHLGNTKNRAVGSRGTIVPQDVTSHALKNNSANGRDLANGRARSTNKRELDENGGRNGTLAKKLRLEADSDEPSAAQSLLQNVDNLTEKKCISGRIQHVSQVEESVPFTARGLTARQSHCPPDQKTILDSSGIECPPLPGRDKRPGTMPQKLFELFTAQADQATSNSGPSSGHDSNVDGVDNANALPGHEQIEEPEDEDDDLPTQQVSGSQWPASPDYAARNALASKAARSLESSPISSAPSSAKPVRTRMQGLPPDSPQVAGQEIESASSIDVEPLRTSDSAARAQEMGEKPEKGSAESREQQSNLPTPSSDSVEDEGTPDSDEEASDGDQVTEDPHMSASGPVSIASSGPGTTKPAQVVRTPHPGRPTSHRQNMEPGSTFVPSTYAEVGRPAQIANPPPEVERSDSDTSDKRGQDTHRDYVNSRSTRLSSKAARSEGMGNDSDAAQHARKMQEHREWRRALLKPMAKLSSNSSEQPNGMSVEEEALRVSASIGMGLDVKEESAIERNVQDVLQPSTQARADTTKMNGGTSNDHTKGVQRSSPLPRSMHTDPATNLRPTARVPSISAQAGIPSSYGPLFVRFKAAYGDYGGTVKHFASACEMLAKPNIATRVHRSLMDDFVFHYANTFLPYVIESAASGEGSMPYTDYFFTLDDLTHWQKVLSSAGLHAAGTTRSSRNSELSQVQRRISYEVPSFSVKDENSLSTTPHVGTRTHVPAQARTRPSTQDVDMHDSVGLASEPEPSGEANAGLQSQHASQQSSVESWLEQTAHARMPSPELGTPDIDRSADHSPENNGLHRHMLTKKRGTIASLAVEPPQAKRARVDEVTQQPALTPVQQHKKAMLAKGRSITEASALSGPSATAPVQPPYLPPRATPKRKSLPASFGITKTVLPPSTAPPVVASATTARSPRPPDRTPASSPALDPALKGFVTDPNVPGPSRTFVVPRSRQPSASNPFLKPPPKPRIVSNPTPKGKEPVVPPSSAKSLPAALAKKASSGSLSSDKKKLDRDWWKKEDTPYQRFASGWMNSGR
jgi:hypothetical protein